MSDKNEHWEVVFGGKVENGVLVGGDVKGETFATRDEAEAEAARMRRDPSQSIRARVVGDNVEKLAARRLGSREPDAAAVIVAPVAPVATAPQPTKPDLRK
jgi:hypothetical protein